MTAAAPPLTPLLRRPEFLAAAASGRKAVQPGLVLQLRCREVPAEGAPPSRRPAVPAATIRLGITASRKVGGAVQRNRARRRLREAARQVLRQPDLAAAFAGHDIVLIARGTTGETPWPALLGDLTRALARLDPTRPSRRDAQGKAPMASPPPDSAAAALEPPAHA